MVTGDGGALGRYTLGMLGYVAPVLVLSGLTRLLYGVRPLAAFAGWLALTLAVVVMLFGELLRLPQWLQDLSPFEHLALVPAQDFRWAPFAVLLAVAAGLSAAGQYAFAHRDLH
jgi:ABC-2 type transport system permease protein